MGELPGKRVVLVPVADEHVAELARIRRTPEVAYRWGNVDDEPGLPFDDPDTVAYAILLDGEVRGLIQYGEERDPAYRHASVDIFVGQGAADRHGPPGSAGHGIRAGVDLR